MRSLYRGFTLARLFVTFPWCAAIAYRLFGGNVLFMFLGCLSFGGLIVGMYNLHAEKHHREGCSLLLGWLAATWFILVKATANLFIPFVVSDVLVRSIIWTGLVVYGLFIAIKFIKLALEIEPLSVFLQQFSDAPE